MKNIKPEMLVPLDIFTADIPLRIDIAYLKPAPENIFGVVYRPGARLWLHVDMAKIVLKAAKICGETHNMRLVLYDGLRTCEAQDKMSQSPIVQKNPHWLEEPGRLLSPPGAGAHPRGMAIDLSIEQLDGAPIDMGTDFDYLAAKPDEDHNPAHRAYTKMPEEIKRRRDVLTGCMMRAADTLNLPLLPLPQEWWDFRMPAEIYNDYAPLSDADLPPQMRMTDKDVTGSLKDFPEAHFEDIRQKLLEV